jgi:hypothetical protein
MVGGYETSIASSIVMLTATEKPRNMDAVRTTALSYLRQTGE